MECTAHGCTGPRARSLWDAFFAMQGCSGGFPVSGLRTPENAWVLRLGISVCCPSGHPTVVFDALQVVSQPLDEVQDPVVPPVELPQEDVTKKRRRRKGLFHVPYRSLLFMLVLVACLCIGLGVYCIVVYSVTRDTYVTWKGPTLERSPSVGGCLSGACVAVMDQIDVIIFGGRMGGSLHFDNTMGQSAVVALW